MLLHGDGIDGLFGLFFHFAVMFDLFEDELVLLVRDVRILDGFADDPRYSVKFGLG